MKRINFNTPILTLDGRAMVSENKEILMKTVVANTLCITKPKNTGNVIRQLDLALKIYKADAEIELDVTDVGIVKDALTQSDSATLVLGQILKLLE